LTRVVTRICLDVLRARKVRSESLYAEPIPELVVTEDDGGDPEEDALLAESVGWALLVVLDCLNPAERLALVLHDVFAVPFDEISAIIGKSREATRMLASRARRKVQRKRPAAGGGRRHREVVDAFLAAAREGDFGGLVRVLDPQVTLRIHPGHDVLVRLGQAELARKLSCGPGRVTARRARVDEPGTLGCVPLTTRPRQLVAAHRCPCP
jgi:RNA polymerase sigma-70 factor (ECF subfamily)